MRSVDLPEGEPGLMCDRIADIGEYPTIFGPVRFNCLDHLCLLPI
jgi:hypothetical protein